MWKPSSDCDGDATVYALRYQIHSARGFLAHLLEHEVA